MHTPPLHNLPGTVPTSGGWRESSGFYVNILLTPVGSGELAASVGAMINMQRGEAKPRDEDWLMQVTVTGLADGEDRQTIGREVGAKLTATVDLGKYFGPVNTALMISTCNPSDSSLYLFAYTTSDAQKALFIEEVLKTGGLEAVADKAFGEVSSVSVFPLAKGSRQFMRIPRLYRARYNELPVQGKGYPRYVEIAFTQAV